MPSMSTTSSPPVKVLFLGDSGMGKTGALASLALAGYSLRVLDYDNGSTIIANLLRKAVEDGKAKATLLENQYFEVLTDSFKALNGRLVPRAKAWERGVKLLSSWSLGKEGEPGHYSLGPVSSWDSSCVLVIDSLSHMGEAAMRYHLNLNQRLGQMPYLSDWNPVQHMMKDLLSFLYDDEVKCNVVVNTHIDRRFKEVKNDKGQIIDRELEGEFPSAPGKALPEKVGSYFNDALQAIKIGTGASVRYKITPFANTMLGTKTSNPGKVKRDYPIETGLADFFKDVRG